MNVNHSAGAGILGGLLCLALNSCSLEWNGTGQFASRQPGAESKWNNVGVWKRVAENPPTYLPRGCPTKVMRVSSKGRWITDKRDGKQDGRPRFRDGLEPDLRARGEDELVPRAAARDEIQVEPEPRTDV